MAAVLAAARAREAGRHARLVERPQPAAPGTREHFLGRPRARASPAELARYRRLFPAGGSRLPASGPMPDPIEATRRGGPAGRRHRRPAADRVDARARAKPARAPTLMWRADHSAGLATTSWSAADSAPQISPWRPSSWRTSAGCDSCWKLSHSSVSGSKRTSVLVAEIAHPHVVALIDHHRIWHRDPAPNGICHSCQVLSSGQIHRQIARVVLGDPQATLARSDHTRRVPARGVSGSISVTSTGLLGRCRQGSCPPARRKTHRRPGVVVNAVGAASRVGHGRRSSSRFRGRASHRRRSAR